ncbi:cupin domain-containing protein [Acidovorax sp. CF316]|uniref:cupin domain-containing protein n=1 Tax=Acidovorax sp. CF316 TaxID=1144317 RepID=UPI00026BC3F4|nr:cupin domain-containing protein [Acidovorax sp. CF316]EJE49639.1 cupin domain-containing protein [Acidovorax sp. CF316]
MHLVRHADAPGYDAPGHEGFAMARLQGREAGPADTAWIGLSLVAPGGSTTLSASPLEKFYVVVDGELEITSQQPGGPSCSEVLRALDSCRIAPGEARQLRNRSAHPVRVLLVMAEPR